MKRRSPITGCINTLEQAQNFKDQGNEYFRGRRYREALGFYTQGIDAQPDSTSIREALLANRAACNLELSMYSSAQFPRFTSYLGYLNRELWSSPSRYCCSSSVKSSVVESALQSCRSTPCTRKARGRVGLLRSVPQV